MTRFDKMSPEELTRFWYKHQRGRGYRVLFPDGGAGSKRATADLANYASNKATAMQCRKRKDIDSARMYERIADDIYSTLPPAAILWLAGI